MPPVTETESPSSYPNFAPAQPPTFESDIPDFLLKDARPDMQWIMKNMSIANQRTGWIMEEQARQSQAIAQIIELQKATNGRVKRAETVLAAHESHITACPVRSEEFKKVASDFKEIKGDVETLTFTGKILKTKIGKIVVAASFACIFFFFIFLYHNIPLIPAIFSKIAGLIG
jgi:hypothetical protein